MDFSSSVAAAAATEYLRTVYQMRKKLSMEKRNSIYAILLLLPSILALVIFMFKPLLDSFVMSFKDINFMSGEPEKFIGFDNFIWMFTSDWFLADLGRTFLISVLVTAIQVVLSISIALLLDFDFPGQKFLRSLLVSPWAIPVFVAALMWKWMYSGTMSPFSVVLIKAGLMGEGESILGGNLAMPALIVALIWHGLPFIFLVVYSGLQQVPDSIKESAMIDGANAFQVATRITVPYIRNIVATVVILRFVFQFNQFPFIHLLTGGGPLNRTETLAVAAMKQGVNSFMYGRAASITTVMFVVLVVCFVIYYRISGKKDLE